MLRGGAGQRKKISEWGGVTDNLRAFSGRSGTVLKIFGGGAGRGSLLEVRTFDGSNFCEASPIEESIFLMSSEFHLVNFSRNAIMSPPS